MLNDFNFGFIGFALMHCCPTSDTPTPYSLSFFDGSHDDAELLLLCIFWIPEQVNSICRDYGVVCIRREGQNVEKTISDDNILNENQDVGAT
ncbi:nicotinamide-nucleotide adenylyltransferase [Trifolium repens]|nr:nicotinamide-nucleotide adenylyltransferase [Trifolium repens]